MIWLAVCTLLAGWFPAAVSRSVGFHGSVCGGVYCIGSSVYCCTDDFGEETCCYKALSQESWFWILLSIGLLLIAAGLFCCCRICYRYHNASQYTKLRRQFSDSYGSISRTAASTNVPPSSVSRINENDDCGQLPTYAAVMRMPPAYSEIDHGR